MEHFQKGMKRKWERHFRRTKMTWAYIAMTAASAIILSLVFIWPQYLSKEVFNSRIANHLIINIEDYYTCSEGYQRFVIDEPSTDDSLFSIYVFNISNAIDVFEVGNKPKITETGPYAYKKKSYKYDVEFDTVNDYYLSFKEFNSIEEIHDPIICEEMYFRQDRDFLEIAFNPCVVSDCKCKNHSAVVTIVNPLILKLLYEDTSPNLISQFSKDIFSTIKDYMEKDFIVATKAHLVSIAFQEISLFRQQMMSGTLMQIGYSSLQQIYDNAALEQLVLYTATSGVNWQADPCGLQSYGINYCPLSIWNDLAQAQEALKSMYVAFGDDPATYVVPSIQPWFDSNNNRSYLNVGAGLPKWLAISYYWSYLEFNPPSGYSIVTNEEISEFYWDFIDYIAGQSFSRPYTYLQFRGAELLVLAISRWLGRSFVKPLGTVLVTLMLNEYWYTKDPVICSPQGDLCVWQWGYMEHSKPFSTAAAASMVAFTTKVNTNPVNFFYDLNSFSWYNSYKFCSKGNVPDKYYTEELFNTFENKMCELPDLTFTHSDAIVGQPAGMWGVDNDITAVNKTFLNTQYLLQTEDAQLYYFYMSCNASSLMYDVYPAATPFHDKFVIAFLNKYKPSDFEFKFTVGKWEELGWAQWGSGVVTYALVGVKTVNQLLRDGFWHFGYKSYYDILPEFSSWAIKMGYPNSMVFDPYEARDLLYALSNRFPEGDEFRRNIAYAGTTLIGDGSYIVNEVGYPGDVAYISEAIYGDFSCRGAFNSSCELNNQRFTSSPSLCLAIQFLFTDCIYRAFQGNNYITNCENFETSISSPAQGIQCDLANVYGKPHPYTKARGNVVYSMMYAMVLDLQLKGGLWCPFREGCQYDKGGMFTTTTVKQILFEGFTESSSLFYLNRKHEKQDISVRCIDDPYDTCGVVRYYCSAKGVTLFLPNGQSKNFSFGITPNDEFFAPKLHVRVSTGDLIWPYSMNKTINQMSREIIASEETVMIHNFHWTAFPDWLGEDIEFQKFYQCAGRIYSGHEGQLANCLDTLNTGMVNLNETLQIMKMAGNATLNHYPEFAMVVNGTSERHQYEMMRWDGHFLFNYTYNGSMAGSASHNLQYPMRFDRRHGLHLELSQKPFVFLWEKEQLLEFPIRKTWINRVPSGFVSPETKSAFTRRFVETKESWTNLQQLGVPHDSYGMPYKIPIGMGSVERLAGAPIFISTPHQYGNQLWGGFEYSHVRGYTPHTISQRTYIDYEPISGQGLRNALRTQVNFRVEKGPVFPNAFSSQGRCAAPTKSFSGYTGYGCFAYIPLLWYEDAESMNVEQFFRLQDHFLSRGFRAYTLILVGSILGSIVFVIGLIYYIEQQYIMRRFVSRVYVD